jgi:hypothetical protein
MVNFLPSFTMHERDITMGLYDEIFWSEEQPVVPRKDFYNAGMAVIKLAEDTAFGRLNSDENTTEIEEGEA